MVMINLVLLAVPDAWLNLIKTENLSNAMKEYLWQKKFLIEHLIFKISSHIFTEMLLLPRIFFITCKKFMECQVHHSKTYYAQAQNKSIFVMEISKCMQKLMFDNYFTSCELHKTFDTWLLHQWDFRKSVFTVWRIKRTQVGHNFQLKNWNILQFSQITCHRWCVRLQSSCKQPICVKISCLSRTKSDVINLQHCGSRNSTENPCNPNQLKSSEV